MKGKIEQVLGGVWQKLKHGDERDIDHTKQCPDGYCCHSHENPLRRLLHETHCYSVACPHYRLVRQQMEKK